MFVLKVVVVAVSVLLASAGTGYISVEGEVLCLGVPTTAVVKLYDQGKSSDIIV